MKRKDGTGACARTSEPAGEGSADPTCFMGAPDRGPCSGQQDHMNMRTLQDLISGIPLILAFGTRM